MKGVLLNMKTGDVAKALNIPIQKTEGLEIYYEMRSFYYNRYKSYLEKNLPFQSPSINPTTHTQRGSMQSTAEHNVYQRADYEPHNIERTVNQLFPPIKKMKPQTLLFNSGMGAISALLFYLQTVTRIKRILIGENSYYETKDFFKEGYGNYQFFNEYDVLSGDDYDAVWLEYPINCTSPDKYPFDRSMPLKKTLHKIFTYALSQRKRNIAVIIDYTLSEIPLQNISEWDIPSNVSCYFVSSLQKHRQYGLDLVNLGVITIYSENSAYEKISSLRGSLGVAPTQESVWLMPDLHNKLINRLIHDSGKNACEVYKAIKNKLPKEVTPYFSQNTNFQSSFIFLIIEPKLIQKYTKKPYLSELLIQEVIKSAKKQNACLVHGTSFGFPFTRIFKNSERYENAISLRVAVGYDEKMIEKNGSILIEGIHNWKYHYL